MNDKKHSPSSHNKPLDSTWEAYLQKAEAYLGDATKYSEESQHELTLEGLEQLAKQSTK